MITLAKGSGCVLGLGLLLKKEAEVGNLVQAPTQL
jgi:hypothetical protein